MKSLRQFILESFEDKELQNLIVCYDIKDLEDVCVQAPATYSEDDVIQFLNDAWFNKLPGGKDNKMSAKLFGKSQEKLIDAHLEYDSFVHQKEADGVDVEWDNKYSTNNSSESELDYFVFSKMKYAIQFESFEIRSENDTDIDNDLMKILESTESSDINKYPIKISLNAKTPFEYDSI